MSRRWLTPDAFWLAAAALLASLHFWFPPIGEGVAHDTYSTSAEGKKAFYRLVQKTSLARGLRVSRNTEPFAKVLPGLTPQAFSGGRPLFCILGPERYPMPHEWTVLLEFVRSGGSVLIVAREENPEFTIPEVGVSVEAGGSTETASTTLNVAPGPEGFFWLSSAEVRGNTGVPLVTAGSSKQAVLVRHGAGNIIVAATDSAFTNEALATDDHSTAALAYRLVEHAGADRIVFDESLNESGVPKAVGLLLQHPLRPVTVQIVMALVLFGWWRSRRFGPLLPEAVAPRQNIVDHTNAAGQLFYRSKNGATPLRGYLRQLILELRLKSYRKQEERVLEPISLRMKIPMEKIKKTLLDSRKASRMESLDRRTAATLIRRLALIRKAARQKGTAKKG